MIKKLHYFSGITISVFVGIHLLNQIMVFAGDQAHIEFMNSARKVYRNPIGETLLMLAVIVQIVSGIKLVRQMWKKQYDVFEKLQIYSGLYLSYFLVAHVASVMIGRYVFKVDTNLYYGAGVLVNSVSVYYFIFHYGLAIISFFTHIACVHKMKVTTYISTEQAKVHAYIIIGIGVTISILIVCRMMQVEIPQEYRYIPFGKY